MFQAIFEFKINFSTIIALLVGILLGLLLAIMLYVLSSIKTINKNSKKISKQQIDVTDTEIKESIQYAKEKFLVKSKNDKEIKFDLIKESCLELMKEIAKKFYPNSKNPLGELTVKEMIDLDRYIMDKIEEFLYNNKGLRVFNTLRINQFLKILNVKKDIDKSQAMKIAKKYNIQKISSTASKIIGVLNPATWAKNLLFNPIINTLTYKICTAIIGMVGEETYHIYSKQAFMEEISDEEFNEIISKLEDN